MSDALSEDSISKLKDFFGRSVCILGFKPLREGIEIALFIDDKGPVTLTKQGGRPSILSEAPRSPDLTFWVPIRAVNELHANRSEDLGEIGVEILKLMANQEKDLRIRVKVHIGLFEFLRGGYLGVLPLGGSTVMKYLASHGLNGIGKIKDAIGRLRN